MTDLSSVLVSDLEKVLTEHINRIGKLNQEFKEVIRELYQNTINNNCAFEGRLHSKLLERAFKYNEKGKEKRKEVIEALSRNYYLSLLSNTNCPSASSEASDCRPADSTETTQFGVSQSNETKEYNSESISVSFQSTASDKRHYHPSQSSQKLTFKKEAGSKQINLVDANQPTQADKPNNDDP